MIQVSMKADEMDVLRYKISPYYISTHQCWCIDLIMVDVPVAKCGQGPQGSL